MNTLKFNVFSGGYIEIDLDLCASCTSKACVKACNEHLSGHVLDLKNGFPSLRINSKEKYVRECTECLACELDCMIYGMGAIKICLPMPELDDYLSKQVVLAKFPRGLNGHFDR